MHAVGDEVHDEVLSLRHHGFSLGGAKSMAERAADVQGLTVAYWLNHALRAKWREGWGDAWPALSYRTTYTPLRCAHGGCPTHIGAAFCPAVIAGPLSGT